MEEGIPNASQYKIQKPNQHLEVSELHQSSILKETLYDIPNCTICLMELSQGLYAQWCGHVFHRECINQNFSYRSQCPICKVKLQTRGIRLFFPLTKRQFFFDKPDQNVSESNRSKNTALELNYRNLKQTNKLLELDLVNLQNKKNPNSFSRNQKIKIGKYLKNQIQDLKYKSINFGLELQLIYSDNSHQSRNQILTQKQKQFSNAQGTLQKYLNYLIKQLRDLLFDQKNKIKIAGQYLKESEEQREIKQKQIKQLRKRIQTLKQQQKVLEDQLKLKDQIQKIKYERLKMKEQEQKIKDAQYKLKNQKYQQIQAVYRQTLIICQHYKRQLQTYPQNEIIPEKYEFDSDDQNKQNKQNNHNQNQNYNAEFVKNKKVLMVNNEKLKNTQQSFNTNQFVSEQLDSCLPY